MSTAGKTPRPSTRATSPAIPREIAEAPPGARFGKFVTAQRLGAGAMGEVYKAWDTQLNRWVALKFLKGGDEEEIARFQREAQVAGKLAHPNIAAIFEVATEAGRHFIAMQFIDGTTLKAKGDVRRSVGWIRDAALAVQAAHEMGVVHRDLKPDNLMVDKEGRLFVTDFGLARQVEASQISVSGNIVGTPAYMAPEQARGERVDARSDVYSLGMTLYELLTGARPFHAANVYETLRRLQDEEPKPPRAFNPRIPADLETVVLKCLEKDPARRYATAAELGEDLGRWLDGEPVEARAVGSGVRLLRRMRRRKAVIAIVAGGLLALTAAVVVVPRLLKSTETRTAETHEAAIERVRQAASACLSAALELRRAGNLESMRAQAANAEAACREVMERFPALAEPHYQLGRVYRALGRHAEAMKHQNLAVELDAAHVGARYERAVLESFRARSTWRDEVRAVREDTFEERIDRNPQSDEQSNAGLRADLNRLASGLGEAEQAVVDGLKAWMDGRLDDAKAAFARAPRLDEAVDALAELEVFARRHDEAIRIFTAGIGEDRGFRPYWDGRCAARVRLALDGRTGEFDKAVAEWTEWLAIDATDAGAYRARGGVRVTIAFAAIGRQEVRDADLEAAMRDFAEADRLDPGNPETTLGRGAAWLNWGDAKSRTGRDPVASFESARDCFEAAAKANPRLAAPRMLLGYLLRGWARWKLQRGFDPVPDFERAMREFDEAVRLMPADPWVFVRRGKVRVDWSYFEAQRGADPADRYRAALRDFDEALRMKPRLASANMAKGVALTNWAGWLAQQDRDAAGTYGEAIDALTAAIEARTGFDEAWLSRGLAHAALAEYKTKRREKPWELFEKALSDYDEALKLDRNRAETWMRRGLARRAYASARRANGGDGTALMTAAVEDLGEALSRAPWSFEAWEARGSIRISSGMRALSRPKDAIPHFQAAVKDFDEAVKLAPKKDGVWRQRGVARDFWAVCVAQTGGDAWHLMEAALEDFDRAIELNDGMADTFWYRGNCRFNRGIWRENQGKNASVEYRSALADYERMKKLNPSLAGQVRNQERGAKAYLEKLGE